MEQLVLTLTQLSYWMEESCTVTIVLRGNNAIAYDTGTKNTYMLHVVNKYLYIQITHLDSLFGVANW